MYYRLPFSSSLFVITLALTSVVGCSSGPGYPCATVTGTVTIDGDPVPRGFITFSPTGAGQGPVTGAEIENGAYRCELVPIGSHTVTFIAQTAEMIKFIDALGVEREIPENLLPPQYLAGLPVQIEEGEIARDFKLTADGNP